MHNTATNNFNGGSRATALRFSGYAILFLLFLALDQWSKDYVQIHYESLKHLGTRFHLYLHLNSSGTLSHFRGMGKTVIFAALACFSLLVTIPLYFSPFLRRCHPYLLGISLTAAGALGNIIDHIRLGYVVDFLGFTVKNPELKFRPFKLPLFTMIFNIADVLILIGLALILLGTVRLRRDEQKRLQEAALSVQEES